MTIADPPSPAFPIERSIRTRRWRRVAAWIVIGGAAAAILLVLFQGWLLVRLSWPHRASEGAPEWGINYSCGQAEYLLLETPGGPFLADDRPGRTAWCAETLDRLLGGLSADYVRLSVEWAEVEPREGEFDFALIDALLETALRNGTSVLLSVGMKGQRHPEYYLPAWLLERVALAEGTDVAANPEVRRRALAMVGAVVAHTAESAAIDAWMAENEPYHRSPRASNWYLGRDYVAEVVAVIRAADPQKRPVAINHAERYVVDRRWEWALADGDIVATSVYPWRIFDLLGRKVSRSILEIGPFAPNYAARAREAHEKGKPYWLTEMQAEPWANPDVRLATPERPAVDLTAARLRRNIAYARRSGADRVYLWGAEWWLLQEERYGDGSWWEIAREALAAPSGPIRPGGR